MMQTLTVKWRDKDGNIQSETYENLHSLQFSQKGMFRIVTDNGDIVSEFVLKKNFDYISLVLE